MSTATSSDDQAGRYGSGHDEQRGTNVKAERERAEGARSRAEALRRRLIADGVDPDA